MKGHLLKTDSEVFQDVWDGKKRYEIRTDDKGYKVGDEVQLLETAFSSQQMKDGSPLEYTDRRIRAIIIHKLDAGMYGLNKDVCALGLDLRTRLNSKTMEVAKWNGNSWIEELEITP